MSRCGMRKVFTINSSLEIYKNDECFLDARRIELLKLVRERGSINSASKELKMSYQQAWHFIKKMNELSPLPVIVKQRGGSNGGGTEVTHFGEKVIDEFERLEKKYEELKEKLDDNLWLCTF